LKISSGHGTTNGDHQYVGDVCAPTLQCTSTAEQQLQLLQLESSIEVQDNYIKNWIPVYRKLSGICDIQNPTGRPPEVNNDETLSHRTSTALIEHQVINSPQSEEFTL
jgi:hypothetical protein